MAPLRVSIVLLALVTLAVSEEDSVLLQTLPKASAKESERVATVKAGIVEKTEDLAKAMKDLNTDDVQSMRKDLQEVFAIYKEDLERDLGTPSVAKKASIVAKTKKLAEAMGSLNADDVQSMQQDFEEVFAMYQEDLEEDFGKTRDGSEEKEEEDEEDGADDDDRGGKKCCCNWRKPPFEATGSGLMGKKICGEKADLKFSIPDDKACEDFAHCCEKLDGGDCDGIMVKKTSARKSRDWTPAKSRFGP